MSEIRKAMSEIRKAISEHARKPQFSTFPSIPKMRTFSRARDFTLLAKRLIFGIKNRENQKIFGMLGNARHFRHCAINGEVLHPTQFLIKHRL